MSVHDLFYSKNRDLSKSDHVFGSESCHGETRLLRTSEKELMLLVRLEKVTTYKTISKQSGLHKCTFTIVIFKTTVTFPRSGPLTKVTPKQSV